MQIQISWLPQKPTDLDLHCLQNRIYPGSAGQGFKKHLIFIFPIVKMTANNAKIDREVDCHWRLLFNMLHLFKISKFFTM